MKTNTPKAPVIVQDNESPDNSLFFKKMMVKVVTLWPWIIGSTLICFGLAVFFLKISSPEFKVHASVLVQDDKKGGDLGEAGVLQDLGLLAGKSNVDNEAEVLKSRTLVEQVVRKLQLNVKYALPDKVKPVEIYGGKPVELEFVKPVSDSFRKAVSYTMKLYPDKPTLFKLYNEEQTYYGKIGQPLAIREGTVVVKATEYFGRWRVNQQLIITVSPFDEATAYYMNAMSIEIPNKDVSVIYLTLNETLPEKGESVLNALISEYMLENVIDKNKIADSTMTFIDDRLNLVSGELTGIEKEIEGFKTENKLMDISEQAHLLLDNTSEYAKQQTSQEVQLSVVDALEDFLKQNLDNSRVVPSSLVMQDPSFIAIIQRYNETQLQRDKMLMSLTPQHPSMITMNEQLHNMRQEMLSSINSIKRGIKVSIGELKKRSNVFEGAISKVPAQERKFLDYSRQQTIKQELYLFLLKKREETAISKSSTISNVRIIDKAKSEGAPFKPKKNLIALAGILAGILLPIGISFGKDFLNIRINSLQDITDNTRAPVLAGIGRNSETDMVVVSVKSRLVISEQFRSLRTNLKYLLSGDNEKVLLITSSMSGEGKSFISINICASLALAGKKVILMEFDLRKPKISEYLNLERRGYSNYIISPDPDWKQWIQPSGVQENFDVYSSGPPPPNPAELLMLPKTAALFEGLRTIYDYIVIDSPPAGMVTDAEIMSTFADATLYIVRHGYTFKQQINFVERLHTKKALPKINLIINDVEFKKAQYGYGASYGYGYGYGYGNYGEEDQGKSKRQKKISH